MAWIGIGSNQYRAKVYFCQRATRAQAVADCGAFLLSARTAASILLWRRNSSAWRFGRSLWARSYTSSVTASPASTMYYSSRFSRNGTRDRHHIANTSTVLETVVVERAALAAV